MYICDMCREVTDFPNCKLCPHGNPCLGCIDYDIDTDTCISNGGCGLCNSVDYQGVE